MSLNANHKRALEIQMRSLEQTLLEIRQRLDNPPQNGFLVSYRPMGEQARTHVEAAIERVLAEIGAIAQEFDLQAGVEDVGSYVLAHMAVTWSDLVDTLSPKLKRYGAVDPSLSETLDPHILTLIELAREIEQAASGEPSELTAARARPGSPDSETAGEKP